VIYGISYKISADHNFGGKLVKKGEMVDEGRKKK
jgi:hypothetical protein